VIVNVTSVVGVVAVPGQAGQVWFVDGGWAARGR
jgi:hypothetical protein